MPVNHARPQKQIDECEHNPKFSFLPTHRLVANGPTLNSQRKTARHQPPNTGSYRRYQEEQDKFSFILGQLSFAVILERSEGSPHCR
jgi:hypothetical protein